MLHLNTGIGIEQTRDFVRDTTKSWGVELREYKASEYIQADGKPAPQKYSEMVMEYGFPGPAMHTKMYIRLKERPLRKAIRDLDRDRKDKTLLVTGVRSEESIRRTAHVEPVQIWEGTKIWAAPIWDFTKNDVEDYIDEYGLERNLVVANMHMSGECLCGAFAKPDEIEEIRFWYPETAAYIERLQDEAETAGVPAVWGVSPPKKAKVEEPSVAEGLLCSSCVGE